MGALFLSINLDHYIQKAFGRELWLSLFSIGAVLVLHRFLGFVDLSLLSVLPFFVLDGSSSSGCCDGGSAGSADTNTFSTPFLYIKSSGKYVVENDVMMGKSSSFFESKDEGRKAYEAGRVTSDLYKIRGVFDIKDNKVHFQLREIEPEESFVDHFSLLKITHPENTHVFPEPREGRFFIFPEESIKQNKGLLKLSIKDHVKGTNLTSKLSTPLTRENPSNKELDRSQMHFMRLGDSLEVQGTVGSRKIPTFFLMESSYRDYTVGEVLFWKRRETLDNLLVDALKDRSSYFKMGARVLGAVGVFGLISLFSLFNPQHKAGQETPASEPHNLFESWSMINRVHADAPGGSSGGACSLLVEYWNGLNYQKIDLIHPRWNHPTFEIVRIPEEALNPAGEFQLRVMATKQHYVSQVAVVSEAPVDAFETQQFKVTKAYHYREGKDYSEVLNAPHSGGYMRTIPADIVDIELSLKTPATSLSNDGNEVSYVLEVGGHYNPASEEVQREANGDEETWVSKLDNEGQQWLKRMHPLRTYRNN